MNVFSEKSKWIGPVELMTNYGAKRIGAPFMRREYDLPGERRKTGKIRFCGLGIGELYFNGEKISPGTLDPAPSVYDRHCYYREYQISLIPGTNVFGVILGNGQYNNQAADFWQFHTAPWRDYPKMIFELVCDGEILLTSDSSWRVTTDTPVIFNNWYGGEYFDARKEKFFANWLRPGFDDSAWLPAAVKPGPGGELLPEKAPPVVETDRFAVTEKLNSRVYDLGRIITGRIKISVRGEAGSSVTLRYSDHLSGDGDFTMVDIGQFIPGEEAQTDRYILHGDRVEESWAPSFVYHSFQYVETTVRGNAEIVSLEAQELRTGFERIGRLETSDDTVNKLYAASLASYSGNFIGIPTDCPHREKNGWTADACFAAESGLMTFDAAESYRRFVQTLADNQRPSGQLPGIAPSPGWGYNYGSGPVWDSALWLIPYYLYIHTGDRETFAGHFDAIRRHFAYLGTLAEGDIIRFGLGDHAHPDQKKAAPTEFICSCFYAMEADTLAKFSSLLGRDAEGESYASRAGEIRRSILALHPNREEPTALALYSMLGFGPDDAAEKLAGHFESNGGRAEFGIVGGKFIPRVLAETGHADTAFKILTQTEYPGWGNWIARGATTLWEYWDGSFSRNHIMFGDMIAWLMRYAAGIAPQWDNPGFSQLRLRPLFPAGLPGVSATFRHAAGDLEIRWRRMNGKTVSLKVDAPCEGTIILDGDVRTIRRGVNEFSF